MMVVLQFNCIFDVVAGGCEYHLYLQHHLDWKPDVVLTEGPCLDHPFIPASSTVSVM